MRPGRAPAGIILHCLIPLSDQQYVAQQELMVSTPKFSLGHFNSETDHNDKDQALGHDR